MAKITGCSSLIIKVSIRVNPIAPSPGQVKLDLDKWKLWKNLFE